VTVAVIVQARLRSTRLPAKVLLPLPTGRTVLEEVLYRCKQIPGVDLVGCAIPDTPDNEALGAAALKACMDGARGVFLCYGPEHDVLARYLQAANFCGADIIVRITADCPLLDPDVCGEVVKLRDKTGADYAANCWPARSYPHGFDCEVFTIEALRLADSVTTDASDREHVGPAIQKVLPNAKRALLKALDDRSHIRWTLDTLDDYVTIWDEFQRRELAAAA
jgi:spore coat polysaccharide biosynthesis protein SpsF